MKDVVIVSLCRTPIGTFGGTLCGGGVSMAGALEMVSIWKT